MSYEQLQWIVRSARKRQPSAQQVHQLEPPPEPVDDGDEGDAADAGAIGTLRRQHETDIDAA